MEEEETRRGGGRAKRSRSAASARRAHRSSHASAAGRPPAQQHAEAGSQRERESESSHARPQRRQLQRARGPQLVRTWCCCCPPLRGSRGRLLCAALPTGRRSANQSLSRLARAAADQPPARCRRSEPLRGSAQHQLSPTSSSMADRATSSLLSGTPTPAPRAVSSSAQESCICCGCDAASRLRRFACSHAAAAWLRWQRLCLLLLHAAASARCGGTGMSCRGASFLVALTLTAPMLAPGLVPTNSSSAGRLFSPTKSGCHLSASRRSIALSRCTPAAPAAARCRCRQRLGPPISRQLGLIALAPRVQQGAVFCAAGSAAVLQIFWTLCTRGAEGGQRRCLSESACSDSSGSSLTCTHAGLVLWRS
jgi:hypothetical protein